MLLRMFSEVFWPNRGSLASRPSVAAASSSGSESMPSTSWICRILATPSPEMASISTRPGRDLLAQLLQDAGPAGVDQLGRDLERGRARRPWPRRGSRPRAPGAGRR